MVVPAWLWVATILLFVVILTVDLILVDRRPHDFTTRDAGRWIAFYVTLAVLFGGFVWWQFGGAYAAQYAAGYLTEYSLSVDNLFVFMIIMTSFAVPAVHQHRVLLVGIVIALVLRAILIVLGAALLSAFVGLFYLFGLFLLYTAWKVWTSTEDEEPDPQGNALVRFVSRRYPTTTEYHGTALSVRIEGRRLLTPMALVMLAIGTTDLLFALDSIPAVLGITQEAYLVLAANAFALMGLRQLYFLLRGLIGQLRHLSKGLGLILAFIGVKLILEALHGTTSLPVPLVPTWMSLVFIVVVLGATALASLRRVDEPAVDEAGPDQAAPVAEPPDSEPGAPLGGRQA